MGQKESQARSYYKVLKFIYHYIDKLENPTYNEVEKFLGTILCINRDYFSTTEHHTELKHKIKACVAGVILIIPLRRYNIPGTNLSNWFNTQTKEEKKKVLSYEIILPIRELILRTNDILEEGTSLEPKEAGEIKKQK